MTDSGCPKKKSLLKFRLERWLSPEQFYHDIRLKVCFTHNVFKPVSIITTIKIWHSVNSGSVNNGQVELQTHSIPYSDDNSGNNGHV